MGALIVSALIAIASGLWWWYRDLVQQARIARLTARLTRTEGERDAARRAWSACEAENTSLRERNTMLTGLVGGEPSWPTM